MNPGARSEPRRPWRRQRIALALAGIGILVATIGLNQAGSTEASWTRGNYHNATLTSGTVNPAPTFTCQAASGLIAVAIQLNWTAPTSGLIPTTYTMSWSGTAGSGSTTVAALTATIPGGPLVVGSLTVNVVGNYSTWTSAVSTSRTVTMISSLGIIVSWTCS